MSDNELIAEFMGWKPDNRRGSMFWIKPDGSTFIGSSFLIFDTSWDWLMPVVEKIEALGCEVDVYKNACEVNTEDMIRWEANSKIEACYKAVVEFIKWYNQNK